jgi:hypothetical protein
MDYEITYFVKTVSKNIIFLTIISLNVGGGGLLQLARSEKLQQLYHRIH